MAEINDKIEQLVNFDVVDDYYKKEDKAKLVDIFKDILFEDEERIRKFLEAFFEQTKTLAQEFDVLPTGEEDDEEGEGDSEEEGEEEEGEEEAAEAEEGEAAEEEEEKPKEESKKHPKRPSLNELAVLRANDFLM